MARVNKLYEKPLISSIALTDKVTVGQLVNGEYKVKTMLYSTFLAQVVDDVLVLVVTRAELQALITASGLGVGVRYNITDAVGATLSFIVQAVSTAVLDETAVNTANGENYKYDITSDTATLIPSPSNPTFAGLTINGNAPSEFVLSNIRFKVAQALASINTHAFEDYSTITTPSPTGEGYCSFDALPIWTGSGNHSHLVGFQSRPLYQGSGNLVDYLYGYRSFPTHAGLGTVAKHVGVQIDDIAGVGPVTQSIGLNINNITRGSGGNIAIQTNGGSIRFQSLQNAGANPDNFVTINSSGYMGLRTRSEVLADLLNSTMVSASVATPSTHKVQVTINGTTYYLLATNV